MIELIVVGVVALVVGFASGALVYRNNIKLFETKIADIEDAFDELLADLHEAERDKAEAVAAHDRVTEQLNIAQAKLSRKKV